MSFVSISLSDSLSKIISLSMFFFSFPSYNFFIVSSIPFFAFESINIPTSISLGLYTLSFNLLLIFTLANLDILFTISFKCSSFKLKFQFFNFIILSNSLNSSNFSGDTLYIFTSIISLYPI